MCFFNTLKRPHMYKYIHVNMLTCWIDSFGKGGLSRFEDKRLSGLFVIFPEFETETNPAPELDPDPEQPLLTVYL